ncbi:MAG: SRPBCC family protein [Methylophilaceae bacterium]
MKSKTIVVSIAVSAAAVYEFASNPENLPRWVPSFCKSVTQTNGDWVMQSPTGPVTFRFVENNPFGVLDHSVRLPSGLEIHNPMRVIPNGEGSEVIFTLFQTSNMNDEQYAQDAKLVVQDLRTLKRVLEELHAH